jgi:hypothetical protein
MEKSFEERGDEGVMITAGKGDFSVLIGSVSNDKSINVKENEEK